MEIKIGIRDLPREVTIETEQTAAEVEKALREALGTDGGLLTLTDAKGRLVLIPAATIGFVDCGAERSRAVGFGSL